MRDPLTEQDSEALRASLLERLPEDELQRLRDAAEERLARIFGREKEAGFQCDLDGNQRRFYAENGSRYGRCQKHGEAWCDRCVPCSCLHCTCQDCRDPGCVQHGDGRPGEPVGYAHKREEALREALEAIRDRADEVLADPQASLESGLRNVRAFAARALAPPDGGE